MILNFILMVTFMMFGLLTLAFWLWMLVDCLTNEASEGNDKIVWALVIILTNWIGAVIYFIVRRPERKRQQYSKLTAG